MNHGYWKPKNEKNNHAPNRNIMPPPRNTMLVCELRRFGLSIMIKSVGNTKVGQLKENQQNENQKIIIVIVCR